MTAPGHRGRHRGVAGRHRARRTRGRLAVRALAAAVIVATGTLALALPSTSAAPPAGAAAIPVSMAQGTGSGAAAPTSVRMPDIGVDSGLVRLGVDAAGALVPPGDFGRAGWFTGGPAPGETGPAVIAGHVDSAEGPAVFYRLAELEPGDAVVVGRADGTTARFAVTAVDRYPKDEFPTERVYGPTPRAELRLITCGGEFDRATRSYRDNVVVSAVLA
jgi:hypothetical protein